MLRESNAVTIIFIYSVIYFYLTGSIKKLGKVVIRNYRVRHTEFKAVFVRIYGVYLCLCESCHVFLFVGIRQRKKLHGPTPAVVDFVIIDS